MKAAHPISTLSAVKLKYFGCGSA